MFELPSKAKVFVSALLAGFGAASTPQAKVIISFTGNVTEVAILGTATPPAGVEAGNSVAGTIDYVLSAATGVEVGPGERAYVFNPSVHYLITITIGSLTWRAPLQVVGVCDEVCGGDLLSYTGNTDAPADFPGILDFGSLTIEVSDSTEPYALLSGTDLPDAAEDIDFGVADLKSGVIASATGPGSDVWFISFDMESATVPVRETTWAAVKSLYARP